MKSRLMFIRKLWSVPVFAVGFLAVFSALPAYAACSSFLSKVVINEYNYINNYIELKVLDQSLTAGGANPFAGWKLALWKKKGNGTEKAKEEDVSSNYTNSAKNTCRSGSGANYTYVKIPFSASDMTNDEIVVLWDSNGGKKLIDLFRLGQSALLAYPSSINPSYSQYDQCPTIENALPSSTYDAPLLNSSGNKDIARLPDGTGPWAISPGTGNNSEESPCAPNDNILKVTKTPSSATVGVGSSNTFTWSISVTNGATKESLSGVTVSDPLPPNMYLSTCPSGATCVGADGAYTSFSKNIGSLAAGASSNISATAYVTVAGTYPNTAKAQATELSPGSTQGSGTVIATAAPPQVLSITRNQPENAFAGSNVSWTITFSETVTGVDAADFQLLPNLGVAGHSIVSVTGSGTTWQVTAYTGNGTGTLGLNLVDNDTIMSGATPLGGAGNGNGNFVGQVYIIALTCITDDFNRTVLGDDWSVTSKSGSFGNPRIVSNRLRLTDASNNVSTSSTFQKKFPAEDNQVTLEFDYFDYGGSGADGISVVFSDALITPEPGGFGGSLGYANRTGVSGFAGGWLGIGIDTFGNYSNPNEGRSGGPGVRNNAVAMRGSGIGQTGYRYLSGTATLVPNLRTNTGHRYRVSIDSRVVGQAMVRVERNTGSGFTTLIDTINVLSQTGQAAVPENLLLTLTGSTGGSNGNHEIDNVQICAVKMNPINNAIHHFRIEHDGNGLTCAPEAVKIIACANNDCTQRYQGNVQITHNNGTFDFSGGEGTFQLSRTTPGTITIGISSSTPSAANTLRCTNTSGGTACNLIFSDVGIQLDGNAAAGKTPIATQIAGKPSDTGFNAATQKIRAVITNTQTGACIPALQNQTLPVNFRYQLPSAPAEGLNDASFIITGTTSTTLNAANIQKSVDLLFDNTGSASFSFTPSDAGRYILRADMNIPVVDSNNNPTGTTLSRNDSSLEFVVRPLAVFVDASGNPKAPDHSGTAFKKAGEAFDLTFSATRWVATADDNNSDGIWDKCQDATLALPGITRVPAWLLGKPAPELAAPVAGVGNLTYDNGDTSFSAKSTSATASNVNFSDVGIIQFRGQSTFLGQNVSVCSPYIGRFIPDHFKVEVTPPLPCPTIDCPSPSGGAAYATQDFITKVTALNRAGGITSNYQGDFDRAIALTAYTTKGGSTAATGGALSNNTATAFTAGSVTLNNVRYTFTPTPGAPINIHLRADESAGDSVSSLRTTPAAASDSIEDGIKIIQGRLRLGNAFGTVQRPPTMDVRTQYWSGNSWIKWSDGKTNLSNSLFSISPNLATLALTPNGGLGPWSIAFTGANKGSADVCANLATMPWLQNPGDPCAKVTFGIYPAESRRTVHTRELY